MSPLALSALIATLATLSAAIVGVPLGALLAKKRFRGRDLVDALLTTPLVLPPTVLGWYLLVTLGRASPIGRAFESAFGVPIAFSKIGCVVAATVGALPLVVKGARAAIAGVDGSLVDAARTLGARPRRVLFEIELPLARRGLAAACSLAFARSLGDFGATLMLAGNLPGETRTAALAVYDLVQEGRDHEAHGLAATLTAIAIVAVVGATKLGEGRT